MSSEPPDEEEANDAEQGEEGDDAFASTSEVHVVVPAPHVEGKNTPIVIAFALTALVAAAFHFTLADNTPHIATLVALGSIYAVFTGLTVLRLKRKHDLEVLKPKSGDITVATFVAALLYGVGYVGSTLLMPRGSVHSGWIYRVYLVIGDAFTNKVHFLSVALLLIGALEEVSWRGIVLDSLEGRIGKFKAALLSSALWSLAHVPTLYRLGDPLAGPNPLLIAAAFGCGMVWCYLRYRTDRLAPAILSHAIFSWAIVEFPLLR